MANPFLKIRSLIVNEVTAGDQGSQVVLTSPTGDVLVLWYQEFGEPPRLQIFDADGAEVSPELLLTQYNFPVAAWLQDGSFVTLTAPGGQALVSQYRRDGTLLDSSPNLGIPSTSAEQIIQLDNGNIVVTSTVSSGDGVTVMGQLLDPSLQPVGTSFEIGTDGPTQRLEALAGGGFFSFVTEYYGSAQAQLFAADGTKMNSSVLGVPSALKIRAMIPKLLPSAPCREAVTTKPPSGSAVAFMSLP